jgi:hypothetical protein
LIGCLGTEVKAIPTSLDTDTVDPDLKMPCAIVHELRNLEPVGETVCRRDARLSGEARSKAGIVTRDGDTMLDVPTWYVLLCLSMDCVR